MCHILYIRHVAPSTKVNRNYYFERKLRILCIWKGNWMWVWPKILVISLLHVILMYFFHPLPWSSLPFGKRGLGSVRDGDALWCLLFLWTSLVRRKECQKYILTELFALSFSGLNSLTITVKLYEYVFMWSSWMLKVATLPSKCLLH